MSMQATGPCRSRLPVFSEWTRAWKAGPRTPSLPQPQPPWGGGPGQHCPAPARDRALEHSCSTQGASPTPLLPPRPPPRAVPAQHPLTANEHRAPQIPGTPRTGWLDTLSPPCPVSTTWIRMGPLSAKYQPGSGWGVSGRPKGQPFRRC